MDLVCFNKRQRPDTPQEGLSVEDQPPAFQPFPGGGLVRLTLYGRVQVNKFEHVQGFLYGGVVPAWQARAIFAAWGGLVRWGWESSYEQVLTGPGNGDMGISPVDRQKDRQTQLKTSLSSTSLAGGKDNE